MSKVIFLRHAQTVANEQGLISGRAFETDLTDHGIKQAHQAGEILIPHKYSIAFIVSSGLTRTNHTANIVNKKLDKEIFYDKRLQEKFHGDHEGLHRDIVFTEKAGIENDQCPYSGGESVDEFKERVVEPMCEYLHKEEEAILVVSHGFTGKVLTEVFFGEEMHFGNAEHTIFDPAEIPNLSGICSAYIEIEL
jgi:broad specificity phosphatase PhoE